MYPTIKCIKHCSNMTNAELCELVRAMIGHHYDNELKEAYINAHGVYDDYGDNLHPTIREVLEEAVRRFIDMKGA